VNQSKLRQLARNIQKDPDDSFSKFALALEFLKQDQHDKALRLFTSIRKQDPDYIGVYYHLGKLYEQLGQGDEAEAVYHEGIDKAEALEEQHALKELKEALALLTET
jgi:lipopolysaccharide biosynthesis regulator YciM